MSTLGRQALEQAIVELNTGRPPTIQPAVEDAISDISPNLTNVISVRRFKEKVRRIAPPEGPIVERQLVLAIECWAKATAAQTVDQALDELLAWVVEKLAGSKLGGIAHRAAEVEIDWDTERRDNVYGKITSYLLVEYQTLVSDATRAV